jgi:hypothetical protein
VSVLLADQDADLGAPDVAGNQEVLGLGHLRSLSPSHREFPAP